MDCPHIAELNSKEYFKDFRQKVRAERIPIKGTIELTFRCNLRCAHCYIVNASNSARNGRELSCSEFTGLLDQIADEGCLWLLLTGGEPLLRRDFLEIYTQAKKKGLLIALFTNGTLLTPYIADYFKDWWPDSIEITLYGQTRATYERVTGVEGSYDRCMKAIDLLLDRGLPLKLKTVALTWNHHEIWDMQTFAESLGVSFRFDPLINAGFDGSEGPKTVRLSPEEVVNLDLADAKRMKVWHDFCDKYLGPPADTKHLYVCGAGLSSFHIDPAGQLSICMMARWPAYDLKARSFREGWRNFIPQVRAQEPLGDYVCGSCDLSNLCGQCPGWAQMETGDQEAKVEYLCQIAHLRAQAFGVNSRKRQ